MSSGTSLYIHIPFCTKKCDYCAFYSKQANKNEMDSYLSAVLSCLDSYKKDSRLVLPFRSLYIGGGTPSVFGPDRLTALISYIKNTFGIDGNAEITVECNPSTVNCKLAKALSDSGVNRISMGVQSAVESERKSLGRSSNPEEVKKAVELFKEHGINNISLDLMLGIPNQTIKSLEKSLSYMVGSGAKHISAYILKLEEGTPLFNKKDSLNLPDDDDVADIYLYAVDYLEKNGFYQYEVSNFSLPGFESKHNSSYWRCEEYLGIGPSAHSFLGGKRFFYPDDICEFIKNPVPVYDADGGDESEYIMLSLRLKEGLSDEKFFKKFNRHIPKSTFEKAEKFEQYGLLNIKNNVISLTKEGFLVSNTIISELI